MTDVMIDIETLSVDPNAVIVSIAAIKFNRNDNKTLENLDQIYIKVDKESCEVLGMHTDENTISWWQSQDPSIRYEALENPENRVTIKEALDKLSKWLGNKQYKIWSHGDDFDCVILSEAYKKCNMKIPWNFWNTRDTRTILDIANVNIADINIKNKHHPLYDCYRQILALKKAFNNLKLY